MTTMRFLRSAACLSAVAFLLLVSRSLAAQTQSPRRHDEANERASRSDGSGSIKAESPINLDKGPREVDTRRVQEIVDALKTRLSITDEVVVSLVARNPRIVSVERTKDHDNAFTLSVEDGFLRLLTDEELDSVVAHELGHVWIFTHHPFLQTEELANQIAMRVVSRESLVRVYEKVWARTGVKGTVAYLPAE